MSDEPEWVARLESKLDRVLELVGDEPELSCPNCKGVEFAEVSSLSGKVLVCLSCSNEVKESA